MNSVRFPPRTVGAARLVPTPAELKPLWKSAWPLLFWALWGGWLAVSDLRSDDVQPAILRMLIGAAILGYARPRQWWIWSLALAAWVPAEPLFAGFFGVTPSSDPNTAAWVLPPIPALVGGFLGRAVASGVRTRRDS